MKFKVGDIANGIETSQEIIEAEDYVSALEKVIEYANLYIEPADKEAERCQETIDDFVRENNRMLGWEDEENEE